MALPHKKGYGAIKKTRAIARKSGVRYAWVDTCCIDKKSSAELTEAINSMYRWYERREIYVVLLSDLENAAAVYSQFKKVLLVRFAPSQGIKLTVSSRFTRG